ncbi:hypothetical protein V6N12_007879 [Hibiscus sabdariffa]|uniref:Secreted protein n=1 Tax=Hibiscus sabdariffa TaxID=183260 RepID=A0ABR2A8Y1_9ROSI
MGLVVVGAVGCCETEVEEECLVRVVVHQELGVLKTLVPMVTPWCWAAQSGRFGDPVPEPSMVRMGPQLEPLPGDQSPQPNQT